MKKVRKFTFIMIEFMMLGLSGSAVYCVAQESCSVPATRAWLTLTETSGFGWDTIWFGFDPTATYGIDPQLCEFECVGIDYLFVFGDLPGRHSMGEGTLYDFRRYNNAAQVDTHQVRYGVNWGTTYTLHWSPSHIRAICDSAVLLNRYTGLRVRMDGTDSTHEETDIVNLWLLRYGAKTPATDVALSSEGVPQGFRLLPNYPNPFNPSTTIQFSVGERTHAKLSVFDPMGREVAVVLNGEVARGTHALQFDGSALSSGVYIARLNVGGRIGFQKMLLMK
jgi:hypothetical protein